MNKIHYFLHIHTDEYSRGSKSKEFNKLTGAHNMKLLKVNQGNVTFPFTPALDPPERLASGY